MDTVGAVNQVDLKSVTISAIVARYAVRARSVRSAKRWFLYERAKAEIDRLNPTPDEYEAAIRLLTKALNI